jgi:hypothetical protein
MNHFSSLVAVVRRMVWNNTSVVVSEVDWNGERALALFVLYTRLRVYHLDY